MSESPRDRLEEIRNTAITGPNNVLIQPGDFYWLLRVADAALDEAERFRISDQDDLADRLEGKQ